MNADTACAIGEAFRIQSSEGGKNYLQLAEQAMEWFSRGMKLNPLGTDPRLSPWAGYGWCLDWLGRSDKSGPYFQRANELDPKNYLIAARIGLHYIQAGNCAAARSWLEYSLHLKGSDNDIARTYLEIANRRMLEAATNASSATLALPPH